MKRGEFIENFMNWKIGFIKFKLEKIVEFLMRINKMSGLSRFKSYRIFLLLNRKRRQSMHFV